MSRGDYNGFTEEDQARGGQLQTTGFNNGMLVRKWECEACLISGVSPGDIIAHLEDYTEPFDAVIWLCYRCHTILHARFDYTDLWKEYRSALRNGFCWGLTRSYGESLRTLSQKAQTQRSPREETVLDLIEAGRFHPPYSEKELRSKMDKIHKEGIRYFKKRNQGSLL